jgi:hypothetical protein
LSNHILNAYAAVISLPEGENPVKKVLLVKLWEMKTRLISRKLVEALMMQMLTNEQQGYKWGV